MRGSKEDLSNISLLNSCSPSIPFPPSSSSIPLLLSFLSPSSSSTPLLFFFPSLLPSLLVLLSFLVSQSFTLLLPSPVFFSSSHPSPLPILICWPCLPFLDCVVSFCSRWCKWLLVSVIAKNSSAHVGYTCVADHISSDGGMVVCIRVWKCFSLHNCRITFTFWFTLVICRS